MDTLLLSFVTFAPAVAALILLVVARALQSTQHLKLGVFGLAAVDHRLLRTHRAAHFFHHRVGRHADRFHRHPRRRAARQRRQWGHIQADPAACRRCTKRLRHPRPRRLPDAASGSIPGRSSVWCKHGRCEPGFLYKHADIRVRLVAHCRSH